MVISEWTNALESRERFDLCITSQQTSLPSTALLRFGYDDVPMGEKPMPLETSIDLEKQQNHQPTSPLPTSSPCGIWEGRGDRSNGHADQSSQSGTALTGEAVSKW
jgi:hypothetical protein